MPGIMSIFAPYQIENFLVEAFDVLVNKPKVAAYRAPGAPQTMHAFECASMKPPFNWIWIRWICV